MEMRDIDMSCQRMNNRQCKNYVVKRQQDIWVPTRRSKKIKSRFSRTNSSRDVKFVKRFDCRKVKTPKTDCKPKLMLLGPTRTLMIVTVDMAGPLPETPRGYEHILVV